MSLSAIQRNLIERVINTVETGRPAGDYSAIVTCPNGPNDIRQIVWRARTTEYGNLRKQAQMLVVAGGEYSAALAQKPAVTGRFEKTRIREYLRLRCDWLSRHQRPMVRESNHRTRACKEQIAARNLNRVPMNGIEIHPEL